MGCALDPQEIESYFEQGYLVVRGLFGEADLARWRDRLIAIVEGDHPASPSMLVMRDVMVAKGVVEPSARAEAIAKIQDFEGDPVLFSYVENEALLDRVEALIGGDLLSIHTMLINKPPNVDGRHPLHQDLMYFPFRPPERIVATWTALEATTVENGCLSVVPGSQRGPLLEHENPEWAYLNFAYFGARDVGAHPDRVHLEMAPGDTVLFHPLLLHGSGRNRTPGFRRAISAHFANAGCERVWTDERFGPRHYTRVRGAAAAS